MSIYLRIILYYEASNSITSTASMYNLLQPTLPYVLKDDLLIIFTEIHLKYNQPMKRNHTMYKGENGLCEAWQSPNTEEKLNDRSVSCTGDIETLAIGSKRNRRH